MNVFEVQKSAILELVIPANSTKQSFTFDPQPFLQNKMIISIEIFSETDMPKSPLGNALPTAAMISSGYLTLYEADVCSEKNTFPVNTSNVAYADYQEQIPLWLLHHINNGTDPFTEDVYQMVPRNVAWNKSRIALTDPLGSSVAISFMLNIGYIGVDAPPQP